MFSPMVELNQMADEKMAQKCMERVAIGLWLVVWRCILTTFTHCTKFFTSLPIPGHVTLLDNLRDVFLDPKCQDMISL